MYRIVVIVLLGLLVVGCTVKPKVSGTYHGTSTSNGNASGSIIFSQPF